MENVCLLFFVFMHSAHISYGCTIARSGSTNVCLSTTDIKLIKQTFVDLTVIVS